MHVPKRPGVTEPCHAATWGNSRLAPQHDRRPPRQTRRILLTRLGQAGLLAAGLELAAACDRLPGQAARIPRVGYVDNQGPAGDPVHTQNQQEVVTGLGDYGYIPGQNVQMESRFPTDASQDPQMVSELLQWGVDVLLTGGTVATQAAKQATSTVPIVGISPGDPVGSGLVQSLARPGGNVTAISLDTNEVQDKLLDLLRLIVPTLSHVGSFYNPENASHVTGMQHLSASAAALGLKVVPAPVPSTNTVAELDAAFETAVANGAEAIIFNLSGLSTEGTTRVAALALSHHLVSVGLGSAFAAAGGLLSYSPDEAALYRRAGYYVDRILKGAKPADLPVEVPTTFELVVNQATARALGVTIPDEVAQQVTSWI